MGKILAIGGVYDFTITIKGNMQFAAAEGITEEAMKATVEQTIWNGVSLSARLGPMTRSMTVDVANANVPDDQRRRPDDRGNVPPWNPK